MTRWYRRGAVIALAALAVIAWVVAPALLRAQVAPTLGAAHQFGVLGDSAVTGSAGAGTVVNGDVGSFPTPAVTNFPPSTVGSGFTLHLAADATVQQAQTDAKAAYDFLAAQGGTPIADALSGPLTPGVYSLGAADLAASTTLTLNGSGIFIFNVASTLTMNATSVVNGTANPCNVYWRVGTSATLNGTSFLGTVIADASITLGGGSVTGRLLAGAGPTGAVIMTTGGNTIGGCSAPLIAPTIAKAFSPASILPGAVSRLTITVNNANGSAISLTSALVDSLPTGVVVAAVPTSTTTCGGLVTATAGASSVTLANGSVIAAGGCTIAVNVTAPVGAYVNTIAAGGLQTNAGNNAVPATASLTAACPVVTLTPAIMPAGVVGVAYAETMLGAGGTAPYSFTVSAGVLPAGLTLTSAGVLAGTPTAAGTTAVTIRGTDANGCAGDVAYSIVIAAAPVPPPACPVITLAPTTIPDGTAAVAYSAVLSGSGGTAPYSFGVTVGTLPAGLTLTSAGVLAGTPTAAGSSTFTIRGTDANGCFADRVSTVVMAAAPVPPPACPAITLAPTTIPNGTVAVAYSAVLNGSGGTAPYSFGVTVGALPAGLTLTSAGVLAGTPTAAGSSTFTIRGTDANGCFADRVSTVVMAAAPVPPPACPAITLAPTTIPNGTVAVAYSVVLSGSGGTAPYSFGVTVGALPAGLTLTSAGVLAGTPTAAGSSTFTIRGTDGNGCFVDRVSTIMMAAAPVPPPACPAITLAPTTIPNGTVAVAYSAVLSGTGGTAPYSFGVTVGTLPAGLTLTSAGVLAGTPTAAGSSTFTIRGTDANGCFADRVSTIVMAAAPVPPPVCPAITLAPTTIPNGTVAVAYSVVLSGGGGTAPYSFGVTVGALPAGLTLTSAGVLAGTPTAAGSSTFTIRGTDANGCFSDRASTIAIAAAPVPPPVCPTITLAPVALPAGLVGVPYEEPLIGSGGTAPYVYGVTAGTLPAGITISAVGQVSGTPSVNGSASCVVRATDAVGCFTERSYVVSVTTPVPTMPGYFFLLLALVLAGLGYLHVRHFPT